MNRLSGTLGRVLLVGACALAALASATPEPGERASNNDDCDWTWGCPDAGPPTDNCPEDETCSPDTPYGLYFGGAPLGDSIFEVVYGPEVTAVGGVQTITVFADVHADPFTLPFDAAVGSPELEIAELAPPEVGVRALAQIDSPGDYLRILEPGTDLLYDRIKLAADPVASVELSPVGDYLRTDIMLPQEIDDGVGLAVLAGVTSELVVQLSESYGTRLVDEEMQVSSSLAGLERDSARWDVIRVTPTAPANGHIVVTAGDAAPHTLSLRVVAGVDEIRGVQGWYGRVVPDQMELDRAETLCFRAMNQGDALLGASWSYDGDDRLAVTPADPPLDNCVGVEPKARGDGVLTVSASGKTVQFVIEVVESKRSAARSDELPAPPPVTPDAGERALP